MTEEHVKVTNAEITASHWTRERCISHSLCLEWGDSSYGAWFGGYCLKGEACYDWVSEIMETLDLDSFDEECLIGKIVRIKETGVGGKIIAIGHPLREAWFNPEEFFKNKYGDND